MSETFEENEKYLVFRIKNELYASPLLDFREVIEYTKPKTVPNMNDCFSGMINLRGLIIGVVNLRKKLGYNDDFENRPSFLICETEMGPIGALIDKVEFVIPISKSDIQQLKLEGRVEMSFLEGFFQTEEMLITIINIKKFISNFEMNESREKTA